MKQALLDGDKTRSAKNQRGGTSSEASGRTELGVWRQKKPSPKPRPLNLSEKSWIGYPPIIKQFKLPEEANLISRIDVCKLHQQGKKKMDA